MNKYKVTYSVTVEAESEDEAQESADDTIANLLEDGDLIPDSIEELP